MCLSIPGKVMEIYKDGSLSMGKWILAACSRKYVSITSPK